MPLATTILGRTSNTMLNTNGESGHISAVSDLGGKAFSDSLLSMMLSVSLSYMAFIMLRSIPFIPNLLRNFIIKGYWILPVAFCKARDVII